MKSSISINYPNNELSLKQAIDELNREWYSFICKNCASDLSSLYVSDGFYPLIVR